jgi:hypothetical protein
MFRTILFTPEGNYNGWKERSKKPTVLDAGEHHVTDSQFAQKESLQFVKGKIVYSNSVFEKTIIADANEKVTLIIDAKAKELGYASHLDILSYADDKTSAVFQNEAISFRTWRTNVWTKYIEIENTTLLLKKRKWTQEELLEVLPVFVLAT